MTTQSAAIGKKLQIENSYEIFVEVVVDLNIVNLSDCGQSVTCWTQEVSKKLDFSVMGGNCVQIAFLEDVPDMGN